MWVNFHERVQTLSDSPRKFDKFKDTGNFSGCISCDEFSEPTNTKLQNFKSNRTCLQFCRLYLFDHGGGNIGGERVSVNLL